MKYIVCTIFMVGILARSSHSNSTSKPQQNREHKIHNIVLYPDKHSWCKTTAIVQVVGHPGCNSVKMDNNVCVGTCFSYIVPRTVPDTPGDVLPYCDSCQPGHTTWKKVTLECSEGNFKNQNLTKYVEYIHDCNCASCKDQSAQRLPNEEDLESDEFDSGLITDTFNVTVDGLQTNSSNQTERISGILKKMNNEDVSILENSHDKGLHKNVWKRLLHKMETSNGTIDSNVLSQQVKEVEDELKIKFNYARLKQALYKLKKYQEITRANNKPDDSAITVPQLLQPLDISKGEEINQTSSAESKSPLSSDLLTQVTSKLPPIGIQNETATSESKTSFSSGLYAKLSPKLPPIGIENETATPTLDVAPQFLKPATGGSEISYHDNVEGHKV